MILKGYTADLLYTPDVAIWLDAWVWKPDKVSVPVFFDSDGLESRIGFMRPIRWWRQTTRKGSGGSVDYAMLCFSVKHDQSPQKRMGDFCGSAYGMEFEIRRGVPEKAVIEKR